MMLDVEIRTATLKDAALLAELGARVFYETYGPENDPQDMETYLAGAFSSQRQAEELQRPGCTFLIAYFDETPLGYARLQSGMAPTCITGIRPVELVRMYSLKTMIGQGVGSRLMQACLSLARAGGHDVIWLGVWQQNPRAIAFYQKWGFVIAGPTTFTIGTDVQHDWLMQLNLQQGAESALS